MKLGLSNDMGGESTMLNIMQGAFTQRVSASTPKAEKRTNKKGEEVYELHFHSLTGFIKEINFEDTEYGKKVLFTIDADKEYKLAMGYADNLTATIYKMIPNIDPAYPVSIQVFKDKKPNDNGKYKTNLLINQKGNSIKWAFTKDNPNNCPPWEDIIVKGEKVGDNTKQIEFLVNTVVLPFRNKLATVVRQEIVEEKEPEVQVEAWDINTKVKGVNMDGSISDEDIPF